MFRHHGLPWWSHVVNAFSVSLMLTLTGVLVRFSRVEAIRQPAVAMLFLLVTQVFLGFGAFLTRVVWGRR